MKLKTGKLRKSMKQKALFFEKKINTIDKHLEILTKIKREYIDH